jgi:nicotinamidase-related amidase
MITPDQDSKMKVLKDLSLLIRVLLIAALWPAWLGAAGNAELRLTLRTRVEAFKGSGVWEEVRFQQAFPAPQTALLICDMWDKHWCIGATRRVDALVKKMAPVVDQARSRGILIVHSPSETMDFYKDAPQRRRMLELPVLQPPPNLDLSDPPLPIDTSAGGCDTPEKFYKAWTREHSGLRIAENDVISDKGTEIYNLFQQQGIKHLLVMGVHTNMCVLNRSFAIKQMTKWGIRCVLVRDLTDSMYDPKARPYVTHEQGTELVIQHIEKYWCPTVESGELMRALKDVRYSPSVRRQP